MNAIQAIKKYFGEGPHGREVTMKELRAISKEDRLELGKLACSELGEEFTPGPVKS